MLKLSNYIILLKYVKNIIKHFLQQKNSDDYKNEIFLKTIGLKINLKMYE